MGALIESVRARGYIPLVEPMLAIEALTDVALPDLSGYQALVFTSANGVRACASLMAVRTHPLYAVGEATADAARAAGWTDVRMNTGGGVAGLANVLAADDLESDKPLLHLSGEDVVPLPAVPGVRVERLPIYRAVQVQSLSADCLKALDEDLIEAVLFYSPRTAEAFAGLLETYRRTCKASAVKALCISEAVVHSFHGILWQDVRLAPTPDGAAMMALLNDL